MEYVVATTVSTDVIHLADGSTVRHQPGSAGFYALAGLRVFTDRAAICGGIGPDYLPCHQAWYERNHLTTEGLVLRSPVTPTVEIQYFPDGSRIDRPNVGLEEFRALDPTPEEVFRCCDRNTKGVYVFKDLNRDDLDALIGGRLRFGYKLMWEISEDACKPENIDVIESYLRDIDIFSINRGEAKLLYGTGDEAEAEARLAAASPHWVFFRRGAEGAHMLVDGKRYQCPSCQDISVVDTTGGGNSSSGAVLYGCCEGYDPQLAGCMGSAAAAAIITQFGVPEQYTRETTELAMERAQALWRQANQLKGAVNHG